MRIRWTPEAANDLQSISGYLAENHPHLRLRTIRTLHSDIRTLKQWPHQGRPGHEIGTRELLFAPLPYIVAYRVGQQSVEILRVYHGAQDRY